MASTLSTNELTQLRNALTAHFNDTCVRQALSTSRDDYGEPIESYSDGGTFSCTFDPLSALRGGASKEIRTADGRTVTVDARLKVAVTTTVTSTDRFRITKRHGATLGTALTFEVIGEPMRTPSGLVVNLRKVST